MRVHFWASGCFLLYCKEEEYILKKGEILKEKKKKFKKKEETLRSKKEKFKKKI